MKTCSSFLNCVSSTPLDIALKVSSSEKKGCSIDGKWANFSLWLYLRTQGELKIRPFQDSRKQFFLLSRKWNAFCKNKLHQRTYLPKSYLWTKNEGNRRSLLDISWPSLLNVLQNLSLSKTVSRVWLKGVHQSKHNLKIIIPKKGHWRTQLKKDNDKDMTHIIKNKLWHHWC